jgi:hypothetical protein
MTKEGALKTLALLTAAALTLLSVAGCAQYTGGPFGIGKGKAPPPAGEYNYVAEVKRLDDQDKKDEPLGRNERGFGSIFPTIAAQRLKPALTTHRINPGARRFRKQGWVTAHCYPRRPT